MQPTQPTIDNNSVSTGLATWTHLEYDQVSRTYTPMPQTKPISINPTKKALRIEIIPRTLTGSLVPNRMPIDDNSYNVSGGVTNDVNMTLTPLSVDLIGSPTVVPALRAEVTVIP